MAVTFNGYSATTTGTTNCCPYCTTPYLTYTTNTVPMGMTTSEKIEVIATLTNLIRIDGLSSDLELLVSEKIKEITATL